MRSTSMTTPMLTLDYDALNEVALKLPAVKSTKPWRDVNSLATTCKRLYQWKKTLVSTSVKTEWKSVRAEVTKTTGWRDFLEKILSDFEDPSRRLFREPILRKISERYPVPLRGEEIQSYERFTEKIFIHRETVSLRELRKCITACSSASLNSKLRIVEALPALLPTLSSAHRQRSLRLMFELLDEDRELRQLLKKSGVFEKIEKSLGDDQQSKILLELSLLHRKLANHKPDMKMIKFGLSYIPDAERWNWMLKSMPQYLDTTLCMRVMLKDSVCRTQLIDYLDGKFSKCANEFERLRVCEKISKIYCLLTKFWEGKKLFKNVIDWFLKAPLCINPKSDQLKTKYVNALLNFLPYMQSCLSIKGKKLFYGKFIDAITYSIKAKAYDQSTSLLIALAKDDIYLFTNNKIIKARLGDKKLLERALAHTHEIRGLDNRELFVSFLREVALLHFKSDQKFIEEFMKTADKFNESGSNFEKNDYLGGGSTANESGSNFEKNDYLGGGSTASES